MTGDSEIKGYPHVPTVKGERVEALIDDAWTPATVTWVGDWVIYVRTDDGKRHRVEPFTKELRKVEQ